MDFVPTPARATLWRRLLLAVAAAILVPLALLTLVPAALGLQQHVVSADGASVAAGSLVVTDRVLAGDLRPGELAMVRAPGRAEPVVRRVAEVTSSGVLTAGEGAASDAWTVPAGDPAHRVVARVPVLGHLARPTGDGRMWLMLGSVPFIAIALAVLGDIDRRRRRGGTGTTATLISVK